MRIPPRNEAKPSGPASVTQVEKDKPKKNRRKGRKSRSNLGEYYGGTRGWKGVKTDTAEALVDAQINRETRKLRRERRANRREYVQSDSGIRNIYGQTGSYIEARNADTAKGYSEAASKTSSAQDALQAQLQAQSAQGIANVSGELARLGIIDSGALASVMNSSQNALNIANQTRANTDSNLAAMQAGANSVGQLMLSNNTGMMNQARNANRNDYRDAKSEIDSAIREARGTRSDLLLQMLEQMRSTGWQQHMDQLNYNLSRRQVNMAASGGSSSGSGSGDSEYDPAIDLMTGAITGGTRKPRRRRRVLQTFYTPTQNKFTDDMRGDY